MGVPKKLTEKQMKAERLQLNAQSMQVLKKNSQGNTPANYKIQNYILWL